MAYFIYRSVTTTKYTKGETFHVFMRETNVSLECVTGDYPASPTSDAGILNNVDHTHLYIFIINLITFHPVSNGIIRNLILSSYLTKVMRLTIRLN